MQHLSGFLIGNDGAYRKTQGNVLACGTKHVIAHTVFAALRFVAAGITVVNQGIQVGVGHSVDMATTATIPAIRSAELLVFFVSERGCTITTIARGNFNIGFIDELHEAFP